MKAIVVYDSVFGNTEQVARAIGAALGAEVPVRKVSEAAAADVAGVELFVVGSPTRAFSPTPAIKAFLAGLPAGSLAGAKVAAFDTRADVKEVNNRFLTFMVKLFGYAAPALAKRAQKKGGALAAAPEGFIVSGTEGPLREGELDRAAAWAKGLGE
jgi:flavodoxin